MLPPLPLVECFKEMSCGDIITTFLGGLLGFLGAYILFRIQRKSDRDEAERKESDEKKATFSFAKEQLTRAMKAWTRQQKLLSDFGTSYDSDPFNDHPHPVNISPAQRTLESIDRKELRIALGHHFGDKCGERVFRSMIAIIDYFDVHGSKTLEAIVSIQQDIFREKVRLDDLQSDVGMAIGNTMGSLRSELGRQHPLYQHLNNILGGLHEHLTGPTYEASPKDFMDHLVTPALELVRIDAYAPSDVVNIVSAAKRAQKSFLRVKQYAQQLAELGRRRANDIDRTMRLVRKVVEIIARPPIAKERK